MRPGKSLTWNLRGVGVLAAICAPLFAGAFAGCGGADGREAKWSYIYPAIIEPSCATASCHSDIARRAGVNFGYKGEAYFQLIDRHFVARNADPAKAVADSELLYLLEGKGARRMPPDFALPNVDIDIIADWIAGGAKED
jgi:hypothetical protein